MSVYIAGSMIEYYDRKGSSEPGNIKNKKKNAVKNNLEKPEFSQWFSASLQDISASRISLA